MDFEINENILSFFPFLLFENFDRSRIWWILYFFEIRLRSRTTIFLLSQKRKKGNASFCSQEYTCFHFRFSGNKYWRCLEGSSVVEEFAWRSALPSPFHRHAVGRPATTVSHSIAFSYANYTSRDSPFSSPYLPPRFILRRGTMRSRHALVDDETPHSSSICQNHQNKSRNLIIASSFNYQ